MTVRAALALILSAVVVVAGAQAAAAPGKVKVPNVVGSTKSIAITRVRAAHLQPHDVSVKSLKLVGTVVAERPRAGARVARGSRVTLSISSGPGP